MTTIPFEPELPPVTNWMTLSPSDNKPHSMSTVIENTKATIARIDTNTSSSKIITSTTEVPTPANTPPQENSPVYENEAFAHNPFAKPSGYVPASTRLQRMIKETDRLIVCPGVYDGLSARVAHEVGFDALYMVRRKTPDIPQCRV